MYNIYCILNTVTDHVYIGQTIEEEKRLRRHRYSLKKGDHHCTFLQRAWNKYGEKSYEFFILDMCDDQDSADEAERFYIAWFRGIKLCYNSTSGGERNFNHLPETKAKLAEKSRGNKNALGHVLSDEARQKMREKRAEQVFSEETIEKFRHRPQVGGKLLTEEGRRKLSESAKGNTNFLGREHSEDAKLKISESRMGDKNPVHRMTKESKASANAKRSATQKGRPGKPLSEETKRKIREARANQIMKPMSEETKEKIRQKALERSQKASSA